MLLINDQIPRCVSYDRAWPRFNIETLTDDQYWTNFIFVKTKRDIVRLAGLLELPTVVHASNGSCALALMHCAWCYEDSRTKTDLAYRFQVSSSYISRCVLTWIQFLYHEFNDSLQDKMFPTREVMRAKCFKKYKNLRVIIDATEFFVQSPTHFEEQGNMYSSYKAKCTFKVLIGIASKGSCVFVSNAYEDSISDNQLTIQSGFLDHINPGDLVMADRGFTIRDIL